MNQSIFYLIAALTVIFATMTVFAKNPIHSALYMVMTFFSITCHYVLLNAQFLAVVNFIVYMGAIMVLIIFAIMFLNLGKDLEPQKPTLVKFAGVFRQAGVSTDGFVLAKPEIGLVQNLGRVLFKEFLLPFELASVLLLSAMVGAVLLAKKD
jgi:NADH-quinone oxidoreductase subunit J